jgi:hypothetical protein
MDAEGFQNALDNRLRESPAGLMAYMACGLRRMVLADQLMPEHEAHVLAVMAQRLMEKLELDSVDMEETCQLMNGVLAQHGMQAPTVPFWSEAITYQGIAQPIHEHETVPYTAASGEEIDMPPLGYTWLYELSCKNQRLLNRALGSIGQALAQQEQPMARQCYDQLEGMVQNPRRNQGQMLDNMIQQLSDVLPLAENPQAWPLDGNLRTALKADVNLARESLAAMRDILRNVDYLKQAAAQVAPEDFLHSF